MIALMTNLLAIRYEVACNILGVLIAHDAKQARHSINTAGSIDSGSIVPSNEAMFKKLLSILDPSDLVAIEKVIALYGPSARKVLNTR